jgi:hypothetical protein
LSGDEEAGFEGASFQTSLGKIIAKRRLWKRRYGTVSARLMPDYTCNKVVAMTTR